MSRKLKDSEVSNQKNKSIMDIVAERCSYYRENPQRFVADFLGITLKLFQKILIYAMMHNDYFMFLATRGIGKTYLVALFAVVRCILYPGSKIVAVSATFKQGKEIVLKITDDFMLKSSLLRNEILRTATGQNDCGVWFKNGSFIQIRVANQNSRGARSNIIIVDESRMVNQKIVDTVIRPMNSSPRQPGYINKPEYSHLQEMNKEMYMSSTWYKQSELFEKSKAYTANFLDSNKKYFICDLPYQLSIQEGLLMREQIENEMSEATFSDIMFSMERQGLFYGSSEDALFNYNTLSQRRILTDSLHSLEYYRTSHTNPPKKQSQEVRVLSLDVALLASKKHDNDASCFIINQAMSVGESGYIDNITFVDTKEGLVTEDLGLLTMRYFYQYNCDYLALDANGIGQAVLDFIMRDRYDPIYGVTYKAMTCINSPELASRCSVRDANKCVYAIKANAKSNNDMCLSLRSAFQNGYINLLSSEANMESIWAKNIKGYNKMTESQQIELKLPFYQTGFLIDELINLDCEVASNGMIKVKEKSGMRKDRYSSLEYNHYVVDQLKLKTRQKVNTKNDIIKMVGVSKKPKQWGYGS